MDPSLLLIGGILLFMVFLIILITSDFKPKEQQRYPDLKNKVVFFSHECGDITWQVKKHLHRISLKPGKTMEGKALNRKVKELVSSTPINTALRITNFAWDLVPLLTGCSLLPENWEPVGAYHFCNSVVMVRYMEKPPQKGTPNSAIKDLYFSAADGHLIHFKK